MAIDWTPGLSVGVDEIDAQHQELFARVNALLAAMNAGRGRDDLGRTLSFLGDYVDRHFGLEEAYMRRFNYPGYFAHKRAHDAFVADFKKIRKDLAFVGPRTSLVLEVQQRLGGWLVHHIGGVDRALAAFLKEHLVAPRGAAHAG